MKLYEALESTIRAEPGICSQETGGFGAEAPPASIGGGPAVGGGTTAVISPGGGGAPFVITYPQPPIVPPLSVPLPSVPPGTLQQFVEQVIIPSFQTQGQAALIAASDIGPRNVPVPLFAPQPVSPISPIRSPEDEFTDRLRAFGRQPLPFLPPTPTVPELFRLVTQPEKFIVSSLEDFVRSFRRPLQRQPSGPPPESIRPLTRQPSTEPAPLIINPQGCTTCGEDFSRLERQRGEVQREIQTEEAQQRGQRIEQQEREIERHIQEEQRPIATRDIQSELQSKYALLSQIQSDIASLQGGTGMPVESQTSIVGAPGAPLINRPPPPELFTQKPQPESLPEPGKAVRFCVYCSSQAESLRFLNGEPSECSVVP